MDKNTKYSRTSTMLYKTLTTVVLILGLCMHLEAKRFEEADCRPRPVPVSVSTDHEYKPYHVVLYRCTGTYNMISPSIKTCGASEEHDVKVDVKDEHERKVTVTLKNHTKCEGKCTITKCGKNEILDDCECHCVPGSDCSSQVGQLPNSGQSTGEKSMSIPLPYMIGMAMVGLFAVFVLVFDAMLCVKKKGFMYTIKHSCCGKSHTDMNANQHSESLGMVQNGNAHKSTDV